MKRGIEITACALLILLTAPLLLLGWLGLKLRRAQPVFIRSDGSRDCAAGFLLFNSRGNSCFPRFLRANSIDLLPVLFDVLAGAAGLGDAVRFANIYHRPLAPSELILRLLVVVFAAMAILGLVLCAPPS